LQVIPRDVPKSSKIERGPPFAQEWPVSVVVDGVGTGTLQSVGEADSHLIGFGGTTRVKEHSWILEKEADRREDYLGHD
jgi:hypothetical protein